MCRGKTDTLAATGIVYLDQANYIEIIEYYEKVAISTDPDIETYLKQLLSFIDSLERSDTVIRATLRLFQISVFNSGVIDNE